MEGLRPPEGVMVVPYDDIASTLNTGDIMLMSGVTSSGAIIKFFDNAQFSHVSIVNKYNSFEKLMSSFNFFKVIKSKYTTELMSWESNTNKSGVYVHCVCV